MQYIRNTLDFHIEEPTAITLGKFDGLHRGHGLLMEELLRRSREKDLASVVFTFDTAPSSLVSGVSAKLLTTNEEKLHIFERTGVDYLLECPFTEEVRNMEPEAFIRWMAQRLHVKCIVMGEDFRFGYRRAGDYRVIREHAARYGYETAVLKKVQEDGRDISSTYIREELLAGNISGANRLLGYEFFVRSRVVHGNRIGRTIGIPTVNMQLPKEKLLPPNGVYVTRVEVNGKRYPSVSNVGCKPTVPGVNPVGVETFLLDFSGDLYGQIVQIDFLRFLRPERKFASMEELHRQIERDIASARKYYSVK